MPFAKGTEVPVEKSRSQIEQMLRRYGADAFQSGWAELDAWLLFRVGKGDDHRVVKFVLKMPAKTERRFVIDGRGITRSMDARARAWEAEERRRWRSLLLVIKAKLEAVESGISTLEAEFLANIMLPDGTLVGEGMRPVLAASYADGKMPRLGAGSAGVA